MNCKKEETTSLPACELPEDKNLDRWVNASEIYDYLREAEITGAPIPARFIIDRKSFRSNWGSFIEIPADVR